jgi:tRNA(Ile)-lysidine synthase TilS/MesJ
MKNLDEIERSLSKKYRAALWTPFITAIKRYNLLKPNDSVAVCISGGKDSFLMAKLFQRLHRFSDFPFELRFPVMNPGYSDDSLARIKENASLLNIPIEIFNTSIFSEVTDCYLCARKRRGHLYANAARLGCNKIALGHHMNDVIETTLMSMLYSAQLQTMPPRLSARNFPGMELIRPMYCVREADIIAWRNYNGLEFIQCACAMAERKADSKRLETKGIIAELRKRNPDVEGNLFNSLHNLRVGTFPVFNAQ